MDLLIENARLSDGHIVQIGVHDGRIVNVSKSLSRGANLAIDAKGGLVLPTFIEPHVHLDKALLGEELEEASSISEARQRVKEAKAHFTRQGVGKRIERVLPWAIQAGVTHVRTHIDVDPIVGTTSVEAMLDAREKFKDRIDIQIVAFPQEGIFRERSCLELLHKALDLGCDVIGGMPEAETSTDDSKRQIDELFGIAQERNISIDVHCDVLPEGRNIEYYATQSMRFGFKHRSTADHLIALSNYDDDYSSKIIALIKRASMNVVSNPCTMMTSAGSKSRGITTVKELLGAGVNTVFGSDNIIDPYNPFGDFNPLSNAWLLAYGAQMSSAKERAELIAMPTTRSSIVLGLPSYGLDPGCAANINIFSESTLRDLLRNRPRPRYVLKHGEVVCENEYDSKFRMNSTEGP